jgi:peptidoglycan/xylan/chitin deacetylase (PgdA/CDA1 family)
VPVAHLDLAGDAVDERTPDKAAHKRAVATGAPHLVLTYDDGPDPAATPAVLEMLAKHGASATFFVLMTRVRLYPSLVREVIHAVLLDKGALLPVSSLVQGTYGIDGICLSVPSVLGRRGIQGQKEIKLWPKEQMALQQSARALKETLAKVKG